MKNGLLLLAFIAFAATPSLAGCGEVADTSQLSSGSVTLSWDAPTKNADGTTLTDLAGYRFYYGASSENCSEVINLANFTTCSIGSLPVGDLIFFTVTALDTSGNESSFSNEVSIVVPGI